MDWRVQKFLSLVKIGEQRNGDRSLLAEARIALRLSDSRLRHIIKAETGLSPGQFVRSLRLQGARELLESSPLSIKEVMAKSGFNDKSYFTRAFKQAFGVSPSSYRSRFVGEASRKTNMTVNYLTLAGNLKPRTKRISE